MLVVLALVQEWEPGWVLEWVPMWALEWVPVWVLEWVTEPPLGLELAQA